MRKEDRGTNEASRLLVLYRPFSGLCFDTTYLSDHHNTRSTSNHFSTTTLKATTRSTNTHYYTTLYNTTSITIPQSHTHRPSGQNCTYSNFCLTATSTYPYSYQFYLPTFSAVRFGVRRTMAGAGNPPSRYQTPTRSSQQAAPLCQNDRPHLTTKLTYQFSNFCFFFVRDLASDNEIVCS